MQIEFTEVERNYIVESSDTDMLLTEVGMRLVTLSSLNGEKVTVEANIEEANEFFAELKYAVKFKICYVSQPAILRDLARRLLLDHKVVDTKA